MHISYFHTILEQILSHLNLCIFSCCTSTTFDEKQSLDELNRLVAQLTCFSLYIKTENDIVAIEKIILAVEILSSLLEVRLALTGLNYTASCGPETDGFNS